jgi:GAF domain-containing protein
VADIQQSVDVVAARFGCAVLVEDAEHRPLWWSVQGEVDGTRMRSILQREPPPAAAAMVSRLGLANATGPIRTPAVPEADMAERWCVPVRDGAQLLGYLWVVDATGRIAEDELGPAVDCARTAAETMARSRPSGERRDRRRTTLLTRLQAAPDQAVLQELLDLEDLPVDVAVAVDAPASGGGWLLPGGTSVHVDPAANATHTSGAPVPLVDLTVASRRAATTSRALRAGARLAAPTWDALGIWHLVISAPDELAPGQIHPGADVLLTHKRPDLLATARCVLDNGGDVSISADELHIHRTTLYYRLDRIEALTGVNLRLPAGRDDLHLALLLAAYRAAG